MLVTAGTCVLAVLTMALTYLIEVEEGISRRDAGVRQACSMKCPSVAKLAGNIHYYATFAARAEGQT